MNACHVCRAMFALIIFTGNGFSGNSQVAKQFPITYVAELFKSGNVDELDHQIESSLHKGETNLSLLNAWKIIHKKKGNINTVRRTYDSNINAMINFRLETDSLIDQADYHQLLNLLKAKRSENFITLLDLRSITYYIDRIDPMFNDSLLNHSMSDDRADFNLIRAYDQLAGNNDIIQKKIQQRFQSGIIQNNSPIATALHQLVSYEPATKTDRVQLAKEFISAQGNDAYAYRYLADQLYDLSCFREAAIDYQRSFSINPFIYDDNLLRAARSYIMLHEYNSSDSLINYYCKLYKNQVTPEIINLQKATILKDVGNYGMALDLINQPISDTLIKKANERLKAQLYDAVNKRDIPVRFYLASIKEGSKNINDYINLISLYNRDSSFDKSLELYNLTLNTFSDFPQDFYYNSISIFIGLNDSMGRLAITQKWCSFYPYSSWAMDNFSYSLKQTRKFDSALAIARIAIELDGADDNWRIANLMQIFMAGRRNFDKARALDSLLEIYPSSESLWTERLAVEAGKAGKLVLLKKAVDLNPLRVFPYEIRKLQIENNVDSLYSQIAQLENLKAVFSEKSSPGQYAALCLEIAMEYLAILRKSAISDEDAHKTIGYFEEYTRQYGNQGLKYFYLDEVYAAMGKNDSASYMMEECIKYEPDNQTVYWDLWTKYRHKSKSLFFKRYIQRNPFDDDRLLAYIQLNTMWSGSALEAIRGADDFFVKFPNSKYTGTIEGFKNQSYSRLGANVDYYLKNYKNDESVAASERYVGWFKGAVTNLRNGNNKIDLDPGNCSANIYFEDGTEAKYSDDCNCGKVSKLQVGPSFIEFSYNDQCDLKKILASDGYSLQIEYDEKGRIKAMKSDKEGELRYSYNERGKPDRIIYKKDTIFVTYTAEGEVDNVTSNKGRAVAIKVTSAMSALLEKVKIPENALADIVNAQLPDLKIADKKYDSLSRSFARCPEGSLQWVLSGIKFGKYLQGNLKAKSSYGTEAAGLLSDMFAACRKKKAFDPEVKDIIDIFYSCLMVIRKSGVAVDYWNTWMEMQEWMKKALFTERNNPALFKSILASLDLYNKFPIVLTEGSKWLQKSDFKNAGFWKDIYLSDILPQSPNQQIQPTGIYYDNNNNIWLATDKGLFIENYGIWEQYSYDINKLKFARNAPLRNSFASSHINDIAFINDSLTYIATNDGLIKISGSVLAEGKTEKVGEVNGLSSNIINSISVDKDLLFVATTGGLDVLNLENGKLTSSYFRDKDVAFVRIRDKAGTDNGLAENYNLLIGIRSKNLFGAVITPEPSNEIVFDELYAGNFDYSNFDPVGNIVYSTGDKIFVIREDPEKKIKFPIELPGNITTTNVKKVYGITTLSNDNFPPELSVLTDMGISIYKDRHFEVLDIPNSDNKPLPAQYIAASGLNDIAIVCGDRISIFEKSNINYTGNKITDILTLDSVDMTIVISDGRLQSYYQSDQPEQFSSYSGVNAMVKESDTSFIANSGLNIIRYSINKTDHTVKEKELFYCTQTEPKDDEEFKAGPVKNIVTDKKGNIWVATGLSVFKYNQGDKDSLTEFNFFRNPDKFPSYTHLIFRIIKTIEDKIWVVCSDERHLYYKSIKLKGGLLQWNEAKSSFDNLSLTKSDDYQLPFNWFVSSYTPIDDDRAILGTASGFAEEYIGNIRRFDSKSTTTGNYNASYVNLKKQHPSLFLGTKGASIGNVWLFGSPSGIICYTNGIWLYPERFNELLPKDQEYGQYGGRMVNAVSVDQHGKIFVGTDLGLMIYNSGSSDPMSFLFKNLNTADMASYYDNSQLQNEKAAIISSIPSNSSEGKLIARYNQAQIGIKNLERKRANVEKGLLINVGAKSNVDSLQKEQDALTKEQIQYLLELEQHDPALFQLLKAPPLDLISATTGRLKDNECMIQYIPLPNSLGINFISRQKTVFREIRINPKQFDGAILSIIKSITGRDLKHNTNSKDKNVIITEPSEKTLNYLYSILIRPVQNNIEGIKNVYIVPFGALYYLPFNALCHEDESGKQTFLVEEHNIGFISTISMFTLVSAFKPSGFMSTYMFADPDGSLPNAREEVHEIKEIMPQSVDYVGRDATVSHLLDISGKCNILHLATHGHLNKGKIDESWLLFADKKLTMADIFTIKLANTEMVVLSTCESGSGTKGLEYATLARAFSNAGVPTIVATLWDLNDYAGKEIMIDFYKNLGTGMSKFEAIAAAQRNYINKNRSTTKANPYYWAPFIVLGKP